VELKSRGSIGFRESFYVKPPLALCHVHDGDARNLSEAAFEISVVRCNNVAAVLSHEAHEAVIGVVPLVSAWDSLESWVFRNPESNAVLCPKLFKFSNDAICHAWRTFREKTVHHTLYNVYLLLDSMVDKVRIY